MPYLFSDVMWTMFSLCVFLYLSLNEWTCISDKKRNSTFYLPSSPILYMEWFIEHMSNPHNFHQIFEIFALHIQTYLSRSTAVLLTSYDYSKVIIHAMGAWKEHFYLNVQERSQRSWHFNVSGCVIPVILVTHKPFSITSVMRWFALYCCCIRGRLLKKKWLY